MKKVGWGVVLGVGEGQKLKGERQGGGNQGGERVGG